MATFSELESVQAELCRSKSGHSGDILMKFMRLTRELRVRDSDAVARYGSQLLKQHGSMLSQEEYWATHEQVATAALDIGALSIAAPLIQAVLVKFPSSMRAKRMQGMYFEASGNYERAETFYKKLLQDEPNNEMILKRMVALEKAKGNTEGAIVALKKYVDVFCNDMTAWEELAELYMEANYMRQALFCYEELLMLAPANINYLVRYADILYTLGGATNYKLARGYYSKAVELSAGGCVRALYGICLCAGATSEKSSAQDPKAALASELAESAAESLLDTYKQQASDKLPYVKALLQLQR